MFFVFCFFFLNFCSKKKKKKICALEFDEFLESTFCILLVVEAFSLQKVVEMREEVVVSLQEVSEYGR